MFDKRHFPYQYECAGCGTTATVEHEDVQDVPSHLITSTVAEAVEYVMARRRGWSLESTRTHRRGALCPSCAIEED
jgi:hypothetical protein